MEILFWFILGMIIIFSISRYNENENLFWKLTISFLGAFLAGVVAYTYVHNKKQDKVEYFTSVPTQVPNSNSHSTCVLAELTELSTPETIVSEPVSQEVLINYENSILSEIAGGIRGQPPQFFDTS